MLIKVLYFLHNSHGAFDYQVQFLLIPICNRILCDTQCILCRSFPKKGLPFVICNLLRNLRHFLSDVVNGVDLFTLWECIQEMLYAKLAQPPCPLLVKYVEDVLLEFQ